MKPYEGAEVSSQFHSPAKQRPVPKERRLVDLGAGLGACLFLETNPEFLIAQAVI
jgi:hypothetical protein